MASREITRVTLDASALIGLIQGDPDFEDIGSLLAALDNGDAQLVQSTATLVEVLPQHDRDLAPELRSEILALLQGEDVQLIDVNVVIARKAAELRVRFGLKTWDAIHLATAIVGGARTFVCRDHKFPVGGDVEGVQVRGPFDFYEDYLPGTTPLDRS